MDTKSPSSSSSSSRWKYHVFLSFRGEDTRNRFTDHLYSALKQKGIFTFRDNEKLEKGKSISLELLKAIEESLFAIVILSKNYASSTWCLDELVKILECRKKMGRIVVPIFYDLDPSTVRKQTGTYARAFVEHKRSFKDEKVRKWKVALTEVANLSGWSLQNRPESESIHEIVEVISHKLSYAFARDTKGLVGMDSRVEELKSLLAIGLNDVRIIGVWGMGGIGSRIIITTRDKHLLIRHKVYGIYEAKGLNIVEAFQLFSLKAFNKDHPAKDYKELYNGFLKYSKGLPLAIEGTEAIQGLVLELPTLPELGELHKSKEAHWNLEAISKFPNLKLLIIHGVHLLHGPNNIPNGLRFFECSEYPSKSLPASFQPYELVGLHMCHSKIEQLWKGIKHFNELKSIKLEDSLNLIATPDFNGVPNLEKLVLKGCTNLRDIHQSILVHRRLTLLNLEGCKNLNSLPSKFEMKSLEILILSGCSKIKKIPEFMKSMKRLSKLHLDGTAITELPSSVKHLTNLASLHLSDCKNLVCFPSIICGFESLKDLDLSGCSKLYNLPENLGNAKNLEELDLSGIAIRELPSSMGRLSNLKVLSIRGCNNLLSPKPSTKPFCLPSLSELSPKPWNKLFSFYSSSSRIPNPVTLLLPFMSDYADGSDMFFRMLSGDAQGTYKAPKRFPEDPLSFVIPGKEISKWFSHRSVGTEVRAQVPSHLCNKRMGMAACLVFSYYNVDHPENNDLCEFLCCRAYVNEHPCDEKFTVLIKKVVQIKSHYLWLIYFPPQTFYENLKAVLSQFDKKESIQMKVSFEYFCPQCYDGVMKCAFRLVYKEDIEDIREMMPQCSNNSCIPPYDGLDAQHDFDNPTLVTKIKRSHDDVNGAGPSGEVALMMYHTQKRIQI
uniref:TIR domain-containing protein n=1 Tax=Fagus sylvatica TaxID=28930 RepID=A0A2N9HDJ7_FAGSY